MTGKFLKSWGDFGGFKTEAGLEFDCFTALALNAKCSVGDQLHPSGQIEQATYDLIGHVYRQVEQKEPWCRDVVARADIAVLSPEAYSDTGGRVPPSAAGALRILQEAHHQFDLVDEAVAFERYRLVILPDVIPVSPALKARLEAYVAKGGAVLCSYESAIGGIEVTGDSPFEPDYAVPAAGLGAPVTPHVMYQRAKLFTAPAGAEVLAQSANPYFNREWRHFCSHSTTPYRPDDGAPAAVKVGRVAYFAHPIFSMYRNHGARIYRQLVLAAVDALLPQPVLKSGAPTTARITVNRQESEHRDVVHILHYIPERKTDGYDVVEEVLPIYNVPLSLQTDRKVVQVYSAPSGRELPFTHADGRVDVTVPEVNGHQLVVFAEVREGE